ncbi:uncharacterized protein L969DRAFT_43810 [Mixia osmundae IAM 14324]|uniref:Uncharacterized protein n=1 Tax=Mixia osmundae (strain CBS 9802 / IAM 14324 / JCM 22182 / KY 12970) TaxID=764103 RepID=G7E045_MIXOS|nr:uncharacterized protein L969DRAFT_43810 [Mixia osmundae IAM 14324]KEI42197.1 hypothetical protein L969DRAFT_43810 [Mixia osmundae IAM 14324]GAA96205.1 hypothetical protein E5Q_02869 [Mixia osmundae IAM 14324]
MIRPHISFFRSSLCNGQRSGSPLSNSALFAQGEASSIRVSAYEVLMVRRMGLLSP